MEEKTTSYKGFTEAQKRATQKYLKESVEEIKVRVPKGDRAIIQAHAEAMNESTNKFIRRAIDETMERDKQQDIPGED